MYGKRLNTKEYTSVICQYQDKYLLLRISRNYEICPGDWEWLTCSFSYFGSSGTIIDYIKANAIKILHEHIMINGDILKVLPAHVWYDPEYNFLYKLHPVLVNLRKNNLNLKNGKFSEYIWVDWGEIPNFDRCSYLIDFTRHLKNYGSCL